MQGPKHRALKMIDSPASATNAPLGVGLEATAQQRATTIVSVIAA